MSAHKNGGRLLVGLPCGGGEVNPSEVRRRGRGGDSEPRTIGNGGCLLRWTPGPGSLPLLTVDAAPDRIITGPVECFQPFGRRCPERPRLVPELLVLQPTTRGDRTVLTITRHHPPRASPRPVVLVDLFP